MILQCYSVYSVYSVASCFTPIDTFQTNLRAALPPSRGFVRIAIVSPVRPLLSLTTKDISMPSRRLAPAHAFLFAALTLSAPLSAQVTQAAAPAAKKALTVDDYTKWKSINSSSISGDGKWVTYVVALTNTLPADAKPVMHLLRLDTNQDLEVPNASGSGFSADSRWLAYQVDPQAA